MNNSRLLAAGKVNLKIINLFYYTYSTLPKYFPDYSLLYGRAMQSAEDW